MVFFWIFVYVYVSIFSNQTLLEIGDDESFLRDLVASRPPGYWLIELFQVWLVLLLHLFNQFFKKENLTDKAFYIFSFMFLGKIWVSLWIPTEKLAWVCDDFNFSWQQYTEFLKRKSDRYPKEISFTVVILGQITHHCVKNFR